LNVNCHNHNNYDIFIENLEFNNAYYSEMVYLGTQIYNETIVFMYARMNSFHILAKIDLVEIEIEIMHQTGVFCTI
jgi:hypothetical protein